MPASRAVLCDIHEQHLDPATPYSSFQKSGRLKGTITEAMTQEEPKAKVEALEQPLEKSPGPALVFLDKPETETPAVIEKQDMPAAKKRKVKSEKQSTNASDLLKD